MVSLLIRGRRGWWLVGTPAAPGDPVWTHLGPYQQLNILSLCFNSLFSKMKIIVSTSQPNRWITVVTIMWKTQHWAHVCISSYMLPDNTHTVIKLKKSTKLIGRIYIPSKGTRMLFHWDYHKSTLQPVSSAKIFNPIGTMGKGGWKRVGRILAFCHLLKLPCAGVLVKMP